MTHRPVSHIVLTHNQAGAVVGTAVSGAAGVGRSPLALEGAAIRLMALDIALPQRQRMQCGPS